MKQVLLVTMMVLGLAACNSMEQKDDMSGDMMHDSMKHDDMMKDDMKKDTMAKDHM